MGEKEGCGMDRAVFCVLLCVLIGIFCDTGKASGRWVYRILFRRACVRLKDGIRGGVCRKTGSEKGIGGVMVVVYA